MTQATPTELQARMQDASDRLADALAAGEDTADARQALDETRRALQVHQDGVVAAERDRQAAQTAEADQAAAVAAEQATTTVMVAVERVQLPQGVAAPASTQHQAVAAAAASVAHIRHELQRGEPERAAVRSEIAALTGRADAKRVEAASIKSRRLAGHEDPADAGKLHMLTSDASDLDGLVQVARQRLHVLQQPVAELRKRLADAEKKLAAAQVDAELHGQADRLRVLEAALIAGWCELRRSALDRGRMNIPHFFTAHEDLRKVSYGQGV